MVGTDREQPAESLLAELLHQTDESLFENVFAVGLNELQELATLQGDEVARHIYGLTLGPTGRKLLEATAAVDQERRGLLDPTSRSGRLADLLEREQSLREEIAAGHSLREEHAELCRERNRIQERIESLQGKQADVERQLSGHRLLARVWPHWSEARDIRQELETIPDVSGFPADGLERLDKLDAQIDVGQPNRDARSSNRSRRFAAKLHCFAGHRQLHAHAAALVGFVEQAGWYRDVTQQAAAAQEPGRRNPAQARPLARSARPRLDARTARIARHGARSASPDRVVGRPLSGRPPPPQPHAAAPQAAQPGPRQAVGRARRTDEDARRPPARRGDCRTARRM